MPADSPYPPSVTVILGHPRPGSFGEALAEAYAAGAREAGAEVRLVRLYETRFDPHVRTSSPRQQALEPDLEAIRQRIEESDHLVFVYPLWWATMPALLKGFLDRILLPDFAFAVDPHSLSGYRKLLGGRSAQLIITMDTPKPVFRILYRSAGERAMRSGVLRFCGISAVRSRIFGGLKDRAPENLEAFINTTRADGRGVVRWRQTVRRREAFLAWIAALRLQFYGMTLLSYGVGALAASRVSGATVHPAAFLLGFLSLFLLEVSGVFCNEVYDQGTDRRNTHAGPFTGGSRVLVEGRLRPAQLLRGARLTWWGAAGSAFFALILGGLVQAGPPLPWLIGATALLASGFFLAPAYTAPPFRLVYRGWGEVVVAYTHTFFMLLTGWTLQGASLASAIPWTLSIPLFASVFSAITLAGIPDQSADAAAGKRTLAVAWGLRRSCGVALIAT